MRVVVVVATLNRETSLFLLPFFGTIALYLTGFTKWPQEKAKSP